jgi:hypothetical protein
MEAEVHGRNRIREERDVGPSTLARRSPAPVECHARFFGCEFLLTQL